MGYQAVYDAQKAASPAVVVKAADRWWVATPSYATQPDQFGGGRGPVVVTYHVHGLPYETEAKAVQDAALILARSEA